MFHKDEVELTDTSVNRGIRLRSLVFAVELDAEHAQRPPPTAEQVKLKERQKFFEEAFQQDMEQYLSTGYLQIAERRGETDGRRGGGAFHVNA